MKPAAVVTLIFLCLVALLHLARFAMQVDITVNAVAVPMWASVVAFVFVGGLTVWLWRTEKA